MILKSNVKPKSGGEVYTYFQEQEMFRYILQLCGLNQMRKEWGYLSYVNHIFGICSKVITVHLYEIDDNTEMFFYLFFNNYCLFLVALKYIHFYNIFVVFIPLHIPDIYSNRN